MQSTSSSTSPEPLAIRLDNVSKVYHLYGSQRDQLVDVLGLQRLGFRTRSSVREFVALRNVSLEIPKGRRLGIVGRNGAGKTTLLKLICGNFSPTSGVVDVQGSVQALMNVGLGFHPEYTGRQNLEASLHYNGLDALAYREAVENVIEFCELGEFLDQPFKTYSMGMQARLMFATSTAIKPDILVVDEMLGAGDAYFIAKSKHRVTDLIGNGCTMLLVSHSMQQVLELCDEAIWLEAGGVRMRGDSFVVVKAYEESIHGPSVAITNAGVPENSTDPAEGADQVAAAAGEAEEDAARLRSNLFVQRSRIDFQEPDFVPHRDAPQFESDVPEGFHFVAPGGISRWAAEPSLKISSFAIQTERGITNELVSLRPARFVFRLTSEVAGSYQCRYGLAFHNHMGSCVARVFSPCDRFVIAQDGVREIQMMLNPVQIGPGEYSLGISVTEYTAIEMINQARRFDLLSRSFMLKVEIPESVGALAGDFFHSSEWHFG